MEKIVRERRFFYILMLICLAGFLVLPKICLAEDFENIDLEKMGKYLELPGGKVEELLHSLINLFYSEWIDLETSGYSTDEQRAVPSVMKKAVQVQALSHLLADAPIEIAKEIVKTAVEIAKIVLIKDVSDVLDKIEKETVQRAVEYGMNFLIENEIRVTPGAIDFKYTSRKGEEKIAPFQYITIYQPSDQKRGEILIRFYSPKPLEPPENRGSAGLVVGIYTDLTHDLPPFIVDIRGTVEDYKWVGKPSMKIDFSSPVPDLGIKLLTPLEKYLLKPIETTIKEVEIIITKVTGKSLGLVDIWNEIKSFISKIRSFSPAGLVETSTGGLENISNILNLQTEKLSPDNLIEVQPPSDEIEIKPEPEQEQEQEQEQELTLEEMQEILDDIAERIDILSQQVSELVEVRLQQIQEIKEVEEIEKLEESELAEETAQVEQAVLCEKVGQPTRNKIIFNEIAWMGTDNSVNNEWIELKNIFGAPIDLTGWQILDKEKQIKVIFVSGKLFSVNGILLLERTDDDSVPGVTADLIYAGILNNTDEALYFFDQNCQLQDEVLVNPNWPAGDNSSKRTMERKYDLSWQTSFNPGGTPKAENSSGYIIQSIVGGGGGGVPPPQTKTPSSYPKILINEIQVEGTTSEKEDFVELYNPNNENVDLTNWYLQRKTKNASDFSSYVPKSLFSGKTINAKNYFLIANASSSFSADATTTYPLAKDNTLILKNPGEEIVDKVGWGEANDFEAATASNPESGKSIGRKWSTTTQNYIDTNNNQIDFEIQSPTPKAQNQSPQPAQNQLPIASFIYSPANPIVNQEILFNSSSSADPDGTITSYIWDFGDSTTSTAIKATTTHNYSTSSDFLVSLTIVDNNNATSSATTTITITTPETPTLEVVINEIAWMGTSATNSADEWIELYNNTLFNIDLNNWILSWAHGTTVHSHIFSTSTGPTAIIPMNGYFLLERSEDDQAISDIFYDQFFTDGFNNNGEKLELKNASGNLIDLVDCSSGWFAGTTTSRYVSMERIVLNASGTDSINWASNNQITKNGLDADGNPIYGTPKTKNSVSKSQTEISGTVDYPVLTFLGSPYIITNTLTILYGNTLTIEPDVNLKFNDSAGLEVSGTLKAIGRENNKIIFTSSDEPNYWGGIYFTASSTNSELNWTEIKYGRRGDEEFPAILVKDSSITFANSTLENYSGNNSRGLKLVNSSSTVENTNFLGSGTVGIQIERGSPTIKNCEIKNNTHGIYIPLFTEGDLPDIEGNNFEGNEIAIRTLNPNVIFKNNRGENNTFNGILIVGDVNKENLTWYKNDLPYIVYWWIDVNFGKKLTIEAGTRVEFYPHFNSAYFDVNGTLLAQGTADEPIIFTAYPGQASWRGIYFTASSTDSILDNVILSYGGFDSQGNRGSVYVKGSSIEFKNSTSTNSSEAGIYLENSSSTIKNAFLKNNLHGIYIIGVCPIAENLTFEGNTYRSYSSDLTCNQQMNICSGSLCP